MPGFHRPRGVHQQLAIALPAMSPSAFRDGVDTPNPLISRLTNPACTYPCQRFTDALTNASA
jgi:hypothetical protein